MDEDDFGDLTPSGCKYMVLYQLLSATQVSNSTRDYKCWETVPTTKATYKSVCSGDGHTEAVRVVFDPLVISYEEIVRLFR